MKALAILLLLASPAQAETLFTQSNGGTVSLVKGLTADECAKAADVAMRRSERQAILEERIEADKRVVKWCEAPAKEWAGTRSKIVAVLGVGFVAFDENGKCGPSWITTAIPVGPGDINRAECLK